MILLATDLTFTEMTYSALNVLTAGAKTVIVPHTSESSGSHSKIYFLESE